MSHRLDNIIKAVQRAKVRLMIETDASGEVKQFWRVDDELLRDINKSVSRHEVRIKPEN